MALEDIFGLGKILPIDKLIDVISKSVGKLSKPYFDKKDIDTKVYEIKKLAEAHAEEIKIISIGVKENYKLTGGIEYEDNKVAISSPKEVHDINPVCFPSIDERIDERLKFQEAKKQINIEQVTAYAAEELLDNQPVTDEPIDDDWRTRFFKIAEDVSNEEMQALWGKILAGEIKQPKTYSLRTLEIIRNLSQKEADVFRRVANFAINSANKYYLFKGNDELQLSKKFDIKYADISLLIETGLMQPGDFISHQFFPYPKDSQKVFTSGDFVMVVDIKANTPLIQMPVYMFSSSGKELLNLVKPNPPYDYLASIANSIKSNNVKVRHGKILSWIGDTIQYTLPLQDF